MSATDRLALPHLLPGQSQKELFHNKSLQVLDLVVAAAVEEPPRAAPPSSPAIGSCYIVGPSASGAWVGQADCLAGMTLSGWQFVTPIEGLAAFVRSSGVTAVFQMGAWELGTLCGNRVKIGGQQVVGARGNAITAPTAGSVIDIEARTAISAILSALRLHGLIAP
jgi:Protein of unknown function (DUF2793)